MAVRETGGACVLVPTMGALHEGHAALVRRGVEVARERGLAGRCVVWVFVNPTQFNDPSDLARYPRTLDADVALCREAGASVVYAPPVDEVYPVEAPPPVPTLPRVATEPALEDRFRPGHFAGVCQVVLRMFRLVEPSAAVFGEKDWQQLQVVEAMTRQEGLPIEIIAHATVREADGLAMSSRNRFLSPAERERGLAISRALRACQGAATAGDAEEVMRAELAGAGIDRPDYAVVRHARTLVESREGPWRALITARVGSVRLLDNAAWQPGR